MTEDIDVLIRSKSLEAAKAALADIEYDLESSLFRFNPKTDQESQMYRVAPVFESVGNDRETVSLGEIMIKVVSNKGLITMKRVAARPRDIADIAVLQRLDDEQ
jgi:hypothetical protein